MVVFNNLSDSFDLSNILCYMPNIKYMKIGSFGKPQIQRVLPKLLPKLESFECHLSNVELNSFASFLQTNPYIRKFIFHISDTPDVACLKQIVGILPTTSMQDLFLKCFGRLGKGKKLNLVFVLTL